MPCHAMSSQVMYCCECAHTCHHMRMHKCCIKVASVNIKQRLPRHLVKPAIDSALGKKQAELCLLHVLCKLQQLYNPWLTDTEKAANNSVFCSAYNPTLARSQVNPEVIPHWQSRQSHALQKPDVAYGSRLRPFCG